MPLYDLPTDYSLPTPETDAFMCAVDDTFIDLSLIRAKMHDLERQRDTAVALYKETLPFRGILRKPFYQEEET
jgi:hypothetical protein